MRLAWATDVHLEFVSEEDAARLCARINEARPEIVLLGGDIAQADGLAEWLAFLDERLDAPLAFVLGNHDYYGGSVETVRATARACQTDSLRWLPATGAIPLAEGSALVGHGGWGDARLGNFLDAPVLLNDYIAIEDLRRAGSPADVDLAELDPLAGWNHREALQERLQALGTEAAATLSPHLAEALQTSSLVVVLCHVPPFREVCWHRGRPSGDEGLPGFACKAVGDLLLEAADANPDREILVLSGHTHHEAEARLRPNLRAVTAGARYREPDFRVLDVS